MGTTKSAFEPKESSCIITCFVVPALGFLGPVVIFFAPFAVFLPPRVIRDPCLFLLLVGLFQIVENLLLEVFSAFGGFLGALGEASDESSDALGLVVEEVTDRGVELTLEIRLQICVLLRLRQLGLAMLSKGRGHDAVNSLLELFVGGFEGCDEVLARLELLEVPVEMDLELLPHLGHLRVGGAVLPLHQVKVPRHAVKLELDLVKLISRVIEFEYEEQSHEYEES